MKSAKAIRAQIDSWLTYAKLGRDAVRQDVTGAGADRALVARMEQTVDVLSDVLKFIDSGRGN